MNQLNFTPPRDREIVKMEAYLPDQKEQALEMVRDFNLYNSQGIPLDPAVINDRINRGLIRKITSTFEMIIENNATLNRTEFKGELTIEYERGRKSTFKIATPFIIEYAYSF